MFILFYYIFEQEQPSKWGNIIFLYDKILLYDLVMFCPEQFIC
ncbi:hypothetical protein PEPS_42930 (plasmid) [Persicobacter psychrovividus]|uniref:Uncharacterized protein n=1 Tax=Persicobacter psychrovividus TaxID=387638 RepID=A0ABN6LFU7_9BACT|nr:hypothetical protein PEPS_42930 [Persicobacter psychrovividus]